jgi:CheY-like chemotaxis protein
MRPHKSALLLEDEKPQRDAFARALRNDGWTVVEAENGEKALDALRATHDFGVLILDLDLGLGNIPGFAVLDIIQREQLRCPGVFVVSARIDNDAWTRFMDFGLEGLLPKPIDPEVLPPILNAWREQNAIAAANVPEVARRQFELYIAEHAKGKTYIYRRKSERGVPWLPPEQRPLHVRKLSDVVADREQALAEHFKARASRMTLPPAAEPRLVVARRWNSWYPSFFDVEGGAYAIVGAAAERGDPPCALIDPGFKAVGVLRRLGVSLASLRTCMITHNHPDHMGGVFEYVTGRHVLGDQTSLFCVPSVAAMLETYAGGQLNVHRFQSQSVDLVGRYRDAQGATRKVEVTAIPTSHHNAGTMMDGSCGLVLTSERIDSRGATATSGYQIEGSAYILGDTEYDAKEYGPNASMFERMREPFALPHLRVAVLHIGCSQMKEGTGKHLYLPGIMELLRDIDTIRRRKVPRAQEQPLLVLVSEWGLEHAPMDQVTATVEDDGTRNLLAAFDQRNLILDAIHVIKESCPLETITLLPADIGLVVGIESGKVYLPQIGQVAPESVIASSGRDGLIYGVSRDASA